MTVPHLSGSPEIIVPDNQATALRLNYRFDRDFEAWAFFTSDLHWDSPECQRKLLKRHLDLAKERGAVIIDLGDLHDVISGRSDPRATKSTVRPEHSRGNYLDALLDDSVQWFSPYASNIVYAGTGNHESKILKTVETDITARWCRDMQQHRQGLPPIHRAGYGGWVRFYFEHRAGGRGRSCRVKCFHGVGGGGEVTKGTMEAQRMLATIANADVVATGHIHEKWQLDMVQEYLCDRTSEAKMRQRTHLKIGSYKMDYRLDGAPTWHMQRPGGTPKPLGGVFLRFFAIGGKHMDVAWQAIPAHVDYENLE